MSAVCKRTTAAEGGVAAVPGSQMLKDRDIRSTRDMYVEWCPVDVCIPHVVENKMEKIGHAALQVRWFSAAFCTQKRERCPVLLTFLSSD